MRAKYVNVSIPFDLGEQIEDFIEDSKLGYRSRAEFVSEACRKLLLEIETNLSHK